MLEEVEMKWMDLILQIFAIEKLLMSELVHFLLEEIVLRVKKLICNKIQEFAERIKKEEQAKRGNLDNVPHHLV